jgi:C-terminal of Roc, COR, domain
MHFVLNKCALYLVCFNMQDMLKQEEVGLCLSFIRHWLSTIHMHAPNAPIFLIGTHGDKVHKHSDLQHISEVLRKNFNSCRQLVESDLLFFPMANDSTNNVEESKRRVNKLRYVIEKTAQEQSCMKFRVPVKWLAFVDAVKSDKNLQHMHIDEVKKIAVRYDISLVDEFGSVMDFFHEYGLWLYYPQPGMSDMVVLNKQWVLDHLSCIVRNFSLHVKVL